ncbi:MAG: hypothetical protein CL607_02250 [Anaerolineaceae bacterium]|nr:hypothetical protein [Anaerolineaceae bacterium]
MQPVRQPDLPPVLLNAIALWADATTNADSARRADLLRDKQTALVGDGDNGSAAGFFTLVNKAPQHVTPLDVKNWQAYLEQMGLSPASVYARISRLSSFYKWLMDEPRFRQRIPINPVDLARPKAPKAYQSEKSRALSDNDARTLLHYVRSLCSQDNLSAVRDYALLRFYFATGKRRSEIIELTWRDIALTDEGLVLHTQEKGGLYRATEVLDIGVRNALIAYLIASERWDDLEAEALLEPGDPLWLRHDRAAKGQQAVTSHGFVKMLKKYAQEAGLGDIHLHQTRHTVARMVGEDSGDLHAVQTVLGHQHLSTTRVYLERISVKRDRHSQAIARRLDVDE